MKIFGAGVGGQRPARVFREGILKVGRNELREPARSCRYGSLSGGSGWLNRWEGGHVLGLSRCAA